MVQTRCENDQMHSSASSIRRNFIRIRLVRGVERARWANEQRFMNSTTNRHAGGCGGYVGWYFSIKCYVVTNWAAALLALIDRLSRHRVVPTPNRKSDVPTRRRRRQQTFVRKIVSHQHTKSCMSGGCEFVFFFYARCSVSLIAYTIPFRCRFGSHEFSTISHIYAVVSCVSVWCAAAW